MTENNAWVKKIDIKTEEEQQLLDLNEKEVDYFARERALFKSLQKSRERQRKEDFKKWLNIYTFDDIKIKNILTNMLTEIKYEITARGFTIKDENQLKNNIATFIYKNSR